ncbi:hypothetical protein SDC9_191662 [bioreactor metagenome]|uniref:Uncharacterized protein n=1 Tax=bioreactor metagenome TaxID=1076179 RepID=A0A645HYH8_9ZZZZ
MRRLGGMQPLDQRIEIGAGGDVGIVALCIVPHALLAAGDGEQLAVPGFIPVPVDSEFGKGGVEGGAMAVALSFGKRAIDIEDQGLDSMHAPTLAFGRLPGQSGFLKSPVRHRLVSYC